MASRGDEGAGKSLELFAMTPNTPSSNEQRQSAARPRAAAELAWGPRHRIF